MNRFCLVWMCILCCSPLFAGDKYALLIGVSKYKHAEMNKPEPLKFPEEDAKALGDLLKNGGYDVETLLGASATRETINAKLTQLTGKGTADGVVLIGLFGHGVEIETRDTDNKIVTIGCFCPFNTTLRVATDGQGRQISDGNGQPLIEPDPASLIKLSDLMVTLKLAQAGNRVIFADCCRTVPNQARGRSFGANFRAQDLPENTSVVFGCSPNEKAFEHADWGHGAFTKCLLDAMTELSAKGKVRTAGLADLLIDRVPDLVHSVAPRDHQTPKLFSTNSVDLKLASISTSKPTPPSTSSKPSPPPQPTSKPTSTSTPPPSSSSTNKPPMTSDKPKPTTPPPQPTKSQETSSRGFEGTKAGDKKELNGIAFRWCPAGKFTMGEDSDTVEVQLSSGFWLGETEVTQGQWQKLMGTTPWKGKDNVKEGADYPASYVNYDDAVAACKKLTSQESSAVRLPKGWKYSLPTEAQWEYACRAGTKTMFSFGDSESQLGEYGWFTTNTGGNPERVGQKKANAWELKDMHGNVWEWCSDWYGSELPGGRDPQGASSGSYRVFRGGGWSGDAVYCRSAFRNYFSPDNRLNFIGFRLAAVPE